MMVVDPGSGQQGIHTMEPVFPLKSISKELPGGKELDGENLIFHLEVVVRLRNFCQPKPSFHQVILSCVHVS